MITAKEAKENAKVANQRNKDLITEIYEDLFNVILELVEKNSKRGYYSFEIEMGTLDKRLYHEVIPQSVMIKFKDLGFQVSFDTTSRQGGTLLNLFWGQ
jgi:hypothetical protein